MKACTAERQGHTSWSGTTVACTAERQGHASWSGTTVS
jgi:hypothetical protein